jgi:hypothetical protein
MPSPLARARKHREKVNAAAYRAGFVADPDGNFSTAGGQELGDPCSRRATAALTELSAAKATTAAAIAAKARIVPIFLGDGTEFEEIDQAFMYGFARDVNDFLKRIAPEEVTQRELEPIQEDAP